ncbi:dihydrofolate reductase family protein [Streptomyces sp. H27-D2]|uniref:dihydrofolate reductase family protein n=1 Tax=Streptomyces sp. H27-D2 TaxID=3046304 RepID=UPI002DB9E5D9|nr:dihydrofolate reductase family protein [Streptomyces sp. H27-D2]MEC4015461.1 dihydrofolate reductase family protein [Streptomyces sp. H27-D2]
MTELTVTTFVSLDGVMQAPGGPDEDPSNGFSCGGWLVPFADADMGNFINRVFERVDAFLLGRRTYEIFAAHWPRVTDENDPVAGRLNSLPKYVVSTTLEKAEWNNSTIISSDVVEEVRRLKARPGRELQIHGSGALARSLMAHGLIDTYHLLVFPVYLGQGARFFPDGGAPTAFRPTETSTTSTGVVIHTFQPTGPAQYGSFALDPAE